MKAKRNKWCGLVLSMLLITVLSACNVEWNYNDNPYDEYERTEYLCSRTWVEEWEDHGIFYRQEVTFSGTHSGWDYIYSEDRYGNRKESESRFVWEWDDYHCTTLRLDYGDGVTYLDDVRLGNNRFTCFWDGSEAFFTGY